MVIANGTEGVPVGFVVVVESAGHVPRDGEVRW